jgi:hypothetical protein
MEGFVDLARREETAGADLRWWAQRRMTVRQMNL